MLQRYYRWVVGGAFLTAAVLTANAGAWADEPAPAAAPAAVVATPGGAPLRVATINLDTLMKSLDQATAAQAQLGQRVQKFKDAMRKKEDDLKKLREPLNPDSTISFRPNTPEYKAQQDKVLKAELAVKLFQQYQEIKLQVRHMVVEGLIYRDINAAVAKYAKAHGIGLVLVATDINYNVPKESILLKQIAGRKVMYGDPGLDISNAVVQMMNQDYQSTHGGGN